MMGIAPHAPLTPYLARGFMKSSSQPVDSRVSGHARRALTIAQCRKWSAGWGGIAVNAVTAALKGTIEEGRNLIVLEQVANVSLTLFIESKYRIRSLRLVTDHFVS